jgi:hypothetical protein
MAKGGLIVAWTVCPLRQSQWRVAGEDGPRNTFFPIFGNAIFIPTATIFGGICTWMFELQGLWGTVVVVSLVIVA